MLLQNKYPLPEGYVSYPQLDRFGFSYLESLIFDRATGKTFCPTADIFNMYVKIGNKSYPLYRIYAEILYNNLDKVPRKHAIFNKLKYDIWSEANIADDQVVNTPWGYIRIAGSSKADIPDQMFSIPKMQHDLTQAVELGNIVILADKLMLPIENYFVAHDRYHAPQLIALFGHATMTETQAYKASRELNPDVPIGWDPCPSAWKTPFGIVINSQIFSDNSSSSQDIFIHTQDGRIDTFDEFYNHLATVTDQEIAFAEFYGMYSLIRNSNTPYKKLPSINKITLTATAKQLLLSAQCNSLLVVDKSFNVLNDSTTFTYPEMSHLLVKLPKSERVTIPAIYRLKDMIHLDADESQDQILFKRDEYHNQCIDDVYVEGFWKYLSEQGYTLNPINLDVVMINEDDTCRFIGVDDLTQLNIAALITGLYNRINKASLFQYDSREIVDEITCFPLDEDMDDELVKFIKEDKAYSYFFV